LAAELDLIQRGDEQALLQLQRRIYSEMESWLDRTEYATHLARRDVAEMVIEALAHRHGRIWDVIEYVVMPSHLHLFFSLIQPGLKNSLEQFKRWTGHQALKLMGGDAEDRFWQDEWFDHWSRSDEEDQKIVNYIRNNPVKAVLVRETVEWPYGSWSKKVPRAERHRL
jgi:REP element-mobilizing transposase RayT